MEIEVEIGVQLRVLGGVGVGKGVKTRVEVSVRTEVEVEVVYSDSLCADRKKGRGWVVQYKFLGTKAASRDYEKPCESCGRLNVVSNTHTVYERPFYLVKVGRLCNRTHMHLFGRLSHIRSSHRSWTKSCSSRLMVDIA